MSYENDLTSNNTDLQSILDTINALPEAGSGSGGAVETCRVTLLGNGISSLHTIVALLNTDGNIIFIDQPIIEGNCLNVIKGSCMYIYDFNHWEAFPEVFECSGDILRARDLGPKTYGAVSVFEVLGDGQITFNR